METTRIIARLWDEGRSEFGVTTRENWKAPTPWTSLYGAVIGDICGSIYEFNNCKTDRPEEIELINDKCYFTDDTVLTVAIADATQNFADVSFDDIWNSSGRFAKSVFCRDYGEALWKWGNRYSESLRAYGSMFLRWLQSTERNEYGSYGNGAAMRISPIAWRIWEHHRRHPAGSGMGAEARIDMYRNLLMQEIEWATKPTHGHLEGIKGAQAVGLATYMAWAGADKLYIRRQVTKCFGYDLSGTLAEIRPSYCFDVTCQGTVPIAIMAFLESHDFVSAIQNAISVGGDSDTIAAITGSIAEAYYQEIPEQLMEFAKNKLPNDIQKTLGM